MMTTQSNTNRPAQLMHPPQLRERYERMARAAGGRSRFIRLPRGAAVHVIEAGDGPPVVHLHGNNTSSLSHLMLLDRRATVRSYLVDRPGFGLSDPVSVPRRSFRDGAVHVVADVLDEIGLDSAVLAGASGGGAWALWCALDRPERVNGLVLIGSVPLLPGARVPLGIRLIATPGVGHLLSRGVRPGRRMLMRMMSSMGEGESILRHPDLLESLLDAARDPIASAANAAEFQALLSPFGPRPTCRIGPDELRRVTVPTLMIWGDHDPVVSVADAQAVARWIPNSRLEVLPAGHVPQLANPDQVALLLQDFARSCA